MELTSRHLNESKIKVPKLGKSSQLSCMYLLHGLRGDDQQPCQLTINQVSEISAPCQQHMHRESSKVTAASVYPCNRKALGLSASPFFLHRFPATRNGLQLGEVTLL